MIRPPRSPAFAVLALTLGGCAGALPGVAPPDYARRTAPAVSSVPADTPVVVAGRPVAPEPRPEPPPPPPPPAPPPPVAEPVSPARLPEPPREAAVFRPAPAVQARPTDLPADLDPYERRVVILTDAVATLRDEVRRSHGETRALLDEKKRLETEILGLRRKLANTESENRMLRQRLDELERRLREISREERLAPAP